MTYKTIQFQGPSFIFLLFCVLITSCKDDLEQPETNTVYQGQITYRIIEGSYTHTELELGFDLRDKDITSAAVLLLETIDYELSYDLQYGPKDINDYDWTPIEDPGADYISRVRFENLTPDRQYQAMVYYISEGDTLISELFFSTCDVEVIGFEEFIVNSEGTLNVINLNIPESDFDNVSFFLGDMQLEVISGKQVNSYPYQQCSESTFTLKLPKFTSPDSLEFYATYRGLTLRSAYVTYEELYNYRRPVYNPLINYLVPSEWELISDIGRNSEGSDNFVSEIGHYVIDNGLVYFYGSTGKRDQYGLHTFSLISKQVNKLYEDKDIGQYIYAESGEIYRYAIEQGKLTRALVDRNSQSFSSSPVEATNTLTFDFGFFHQGHFYGSAGGATYVYEIEQQSVAETSGSLIDLLNLDKVYYLDSYVIGVYQSGLYQLSIIFDPATNRFREVELPNSYESLIALEKNGDVFLGSPNKVLLKLSENGSAWEEFSPFTLAGISEVNDISVSSFFVEENQKHIILAGSNAYGYKPF